MALRSELEKLEIRVGVLEKLLDKVFTMAQEAVVKCSILEKAKESGALSDPLVNPYDDFGLYSSEKRRFDAEQKANSDEGKEAERVKLNVSPFNIGLGVQGRVEDKGIYGSSIEEEEDKRTVGDELL